MSIKYGTWHVGSPSFLEESYINVKNKFIRTLNCSIAKEINAEFFLASTSEIYGDPEIHPQNESYKGLLIA